jgi:hypothetical protein
VIEIEQQVIPTLVVSHVSILQVLIAYFRNSRIESCMGIEVPMHTVIKFTPVRGGGWMEERIPLTESLGVAGGTLVPVESNSEISALGMEEAPMSPIWGDHCANNINPRSRVSSLDHHVRVGQPAFPTY